MRNEQIAQLVENSRKKDFSSFARLLSYLEKAGARALLNEPSLLSPGRQALRIGITGPPGAGKSTIVGGLLQRFRGYGLRIGVLAVDPSSPFTRGAILGDRIRYADHALHSNVFIRSLGTRGSLGGLSASAYLMLRAFDAAHFDVVLIETVGVGQSELEIVHVGDVVCVVLVPESGDSVQAMKAGLLEIADIFVVNKADRPGAESMVKELESGFSAKSLKVLKTVATEGQGLDELFDYFQQTRTSCQVFHNSSERLRQEAFSLCRAQLENQLYQSVGGIRDVDSFSRILSNLLDSAKA